MSRDRKKKKRKEKHWKKKEIWTKKRKKIRWKLVAENATALMIAPATGPVGVVFYALVASGTQKFAH